LAKRCFFGLGSCIYEETLGKNLRLSRYGTHPVNMPIREIGNFEAGEANRPSAFFCPIRFFFQTLILSLTVSLSGARASGQIKPPADAGEALPQDSGARGLQQMLRRLGTTARLMQTVAHPDDEDGGMLTLESRGKGDTVLLMTLNRGEGGQNKLGSNLFDGLGVLRTLELLAADRYYGVEQRFSRVADFGFSKTAEETFGKWGGHDVALGDMVRVIRTFRPDVLVSRFSGTERDGHGHHQASSILTQEAFRAAADPNRFPEQIKEGLLPWQAKKLYIGNVCSFGAQTCPDANYTLRLNSGLQDSLLGSSAIQFAMEGLRHQLSQGAGAWTVDPGDRFTFYKLVDSVPPKTAASDAHEKDFFDGIDTSLVGLAERLGSDEARLPDLRVQLGKVQSEIEEARKMAANDPNAAAKPLLEALLTVDGLIVKVVQQPGLNALAQKELLVQLRTKQAQLQQAANLALGVSLSARVDTAVAATPEDAFMAVPGQAFTMTLRIRNAGKTELVIQKVESNVPEGWHASLTSTKPGNIQPGEEGTAQFRVTVAENAEYTRPYWHRHDPETESVNTIDEEKYATLPFPPPPVRAFVSYTADGMAGDIRSTATVAFKDSEGHEKRRALAVSPAFSVEVKPSSQVIPLGHDGASPIDVGVKSFYPGGKGRLQLALPTGWRVEPESQRLDFAKVGESKSSKFRVSPSAEKEGRSEVKASLAALGKSFGEGFNVVTRDDLDTFYYYQPAVQRLSLVDVKVPAGLKIGYVMGAGDDIPTVLQQIGMDVALIPAEKLATEDLGKYGTIVLGIRAYDTQRDVVMNNQRLLDYVSAGGTLVVQYDTAVGQFNERKLAPYPAQLSRARVSVEDAPVDILAPDNRVFHSPNEITQRDFAGWVQERGLYFMGSWDSQFTPLLASHDPGELAQKGGLLIAKYGKGTYIYTGYAFFRQLPAGVPGAVRLYVNLLAAGH
jgi:LmbE family N-acetylglucosaminyl deacetylase